MDDVGAVLEIKWDVHNPIEVRDLGDALKALADRYDDFSKVRYGAKASDARFYIQEIRKGSIIVEFVATSVGLMDQGLILKQFYTLVKGDLGAYARGLIPKGHKNENAQSYAEILRAVLNSDGDDDAISFAFREKKANGDEAAFALSKGDVKDITSQVFTSLNRDETIENLVSRETEPRRELMRLYQHNMDPSAADKKRTNHKAIVSRYDRSPKALLYANKTVADELKEIISEEPYGQIIFDVTAVVCSENGKIKAYRLIDIHDSFEDDDPDQIELLN